MPPKYWNLRRFYKPALIVPQR